MELQKIVVIGPESTGKSTLCQRLATHYNTAWVPEYARAYLHSRGPDYDYNDLLSIAIGQIALEESIGAKLLSDIDKSKHFLFVDTDMYVMKVWAEFVFNDCQNRILDLIAERKYAAYLLCNTDLPWEKDELREYPDLKTREKLYHFYKDALLQQTLPWCNISGDYEARFSAATGFLDALVLSGS